MIQLKKLIAEQKLKFPITISGGYSVPSNVPNKADALHSFERRRSDGFGGRMTTQIDNKLQELYKQGINPDITNIKIMIDSANLKVKWWATLQPSKDGKAYVGVSTVGSAGGNADMRAWNQIEGMKSRVAKQYGAVDFKPVLDFKNVDGIYIRQYFYKWTSPSKFPPHNSTTIEQNNLIRKMIGTLKYMLIDNPEKHFGQFSSISPIYIKSAPGGNYRIGSGDDEIAAAKWLYNYFHKYMLPKLEAIKPMCTSYDKANIDQINELVSKIIGYIQKGEHRELTLDYYVFDPKTTKYYTKSILFDWNYL